MKEKCIFLPSVDSKYLPFLYNDIVELKPEFDRRGIIIGVNPIIGNGVLLGNNVNIGNNVCIGSNSNIGHQCTIFDHSNIGNNVILEKFSEIHNNVIIHSYCIIGTKSIINNNSIIGEYTTIEPSSIIESDLIVKPYNNNHIISISEIVEFINRQGVHYENIIGVNENDLNFVKNLGVLNEHSILGLDLQNAIDATSTSNNIKILASNLVQKAFLKQESYTFESEHSRIILN